MTELVCETNFDIKMAVGRPDTNWLDGIKKAFSEAKI